MVKPLVRRLPLGSPQGLLRLQRIVNDDDVGATSSQHPADRGGEPAALCRRLELRHGPPLGGETGPEGPLIPAARGDAAAITGELVGEILPPGYARDRPSPSKPGGDTEDLRAGLALEAPLVRGLMSAGGASGSRYLTGVTSRLRPHPGWHLEPRLELGRDLLVRRADGGGKSGRRARLRLEVQHPPMRDR